MTVEKQLPEHDNEIDQSIKTVKTIKTEINEETKNKIDQRIIETEHGSTSNTIVAPIEDKNSNEVTTAEQINNAETSTSANLTTAADVQIEKMDETETAKLDDNAKASKAVEIADTVVKTETIDTKTIDEIGVNEAAVKPSITVESNTVQISDEVRTNITIENIDQLEKCVSTEKINEIEKAGDDASSSQTDTSKQINVNEKSSEILSEIVHQISIDDAAEKTNKIENVLPSKNAMEVDNKDVRKGNELNVTVTADTQDDIKSEKVDEVESIVDAVVSIKSENSDESQTINKDTSSNEFATCVQTDICNENTADESTTNNSTANANESLGISSKDQTELAVEIPVEPQTINEQVIADEVCSDVQTERIDESDDQVLIGNEATHTKTSDELILNDKTVNETEQSVDVDGKNESEQKKDDAENIEEIADENMSIEIDDNKTANANGILDISLIECNEIEITTTVADINENKKDDEILPKSPNEKIRFGIKDISLLTNPTFEQNVQPKLATKPFEPATKRRKLAIATKECLNIECSHKSREFYKAPEFILSHFHIAKKQKTLYICDDCFEIALIKYEEMCASLANKEPLYKAKVEHRPDLVEILDSSDEDDGNDTNPTDTETSFNVETLAMIENNLEDVIIKSMERFNINQQMDENRKILHKQFDTQYNESSKLLLDLKDLQKLADKIYQETYSGSSAIVEEMSSWDSTTGKPLQIANATYPPVGDFVHAEIDMNLAYYTVRTKLIASWVPCRITESIKGAVETLYRAKFIRYHRGSQTKVVSRKNLAYWKPPEFRLNVGTRVIALFTVSTSVPDSKEVMHRACFFPGIIAEPLRDYNHWRYLIFFDDGYAQYVLHENVRVVCEYSERVWEDVVPESRDFIEHYLKQFSQMRPMVQVRKGQRMMTELSGKWINALVNAVDGSLVQMYFEDSKRHEWIYRGSTRLGPLFRQRFNQQNIINSAKKQPSIEYILIDDDKADGQTSAAAEQKQDKQEQEPSKAGTPAKTLSQRTFPAQAIRDTPQKQREQREQQKQREQQQEREQRDEKRAVAKKSSSLPPRPTVQHLNNSTIYVDEDNKPKGKVVYYTAKRHLPPRKFVDHHCGRSCLYEVSHNLSTYSPLSKPLLSGWERQIGKSKGKKMVIYKAPCGRRLRNMSELHLYLRITDCPLNVENFDYDYLIHCLAEYVIDTCIINKPDISEGIENMVVPFVNYYDTTMPPACVYSAKRIPTEGVNLNLATEFMCGCDCTDDCRDKTKCQCWQLTIAGAKFGNPYTPPEEVGYEFKRLPEPVPTGIYECNSNCKCKSRCLNRVAQQPIQMKLQVFKTENRGWGLRCLNDVPRGSFICCYAGNLLTEQHANEAGGDLGDEYFAELDYIEVVENLKEGYEPDVLQDDDDDDEASDDEFDPEKEGPTKEDDSDDEFISRCSLDDTEPRIKTRYRTRNSIDSKKKEEKKVGASESSGLSDDENDERQPISFTPSNTLLMDKENDTGRYKSIRKFYGKNEAVYIMDAKKTGNIGRYFNVRHFCMKNQF